MDDTEPIICARLIIFILDLGNVSVGVRLENYFRAQIFQ